MTDWISVKDRLPEDDLSPDSKTQLRMRNYWIQRPELWAWKHSGGEITHWMPLPPPPKEEV